MSKLDRYIICCSFFIALLSRIVWLRYYAVGLVRGDSIKYLEQAQDPLSVDQHFGYVALLRFIGGDGAVSIAVHLLTGALCAPLVYVLSLELFKPRRVAIWSLIFFLFYVPAIEYSARLLTEPFITVMLLAMATLLWRERSLD